MSNQRFHAYSPTRGASQSQRGGSAHSPNRRTPGASPRYPSSVYHGSHQHPLQHLTHQSPHPLHNQDSYAGVHSNYGHGFAYGDAGAAASIGHSTLHSQDPNFQIGESASCQFAAELRRKAPPGTWALNLTSVLDDAERKTITDLLSDVKKSLSPSLKCDLNSVSHDIQSCYCQKIQSCVSYPHRLLEAIDELHDLQRRLKIELGELQASHRSLLVDQHYLNTASSDASARPISAALIATHKETVQVCEENIQGSRATNDLLLTMIEAIRNIVRDGCDFANCHEMVKALANGQGVHLYNQPTASNLALLYKLPLASVFASDLSRLMSKSSNGSAEELITMLQELHQKHLPFLADDDEMDHSCAKIVISKLIEFFSFNYSVWDAIVKFGKHRGTIPLEFSKPVPYTWHGSIDIHWNRLYLRVLLCDESNRMLLPPPVEKAIKDMDLDV